MESWPAGGLASADNSHRSDNCCYETYTEVENVPWVTEYMYLNITCLNPLLAFHYSYQC